LAAGQTPGSISQWRGRDDRNGSTTAWNTWFSPIDRQRPSWSDPVRISDEVGWSGLQDCRRLCIPYGDYFEIAVDGSVEPQSHMG